MAIQLTTIGENARAASRVLASIGAEEKNKALRAMATAIREHVDLILAANKTDVESAATRDLSSAFIDRLQLDDQRVEAMAKGLEDIATLPDPVGTVLSEWDRPNGLHISRVRVPLGVIGVIFESRPNVTADAAALCLKSGNAVILRGGSDSFQSCKAIMKAISDGLQQTACPLPSIQMIPTQDRAAVGEMLQMDQYIDVIIPRGGKSLIQRITDESKIPLFKHLEGICHTYLHHDADLDMATNVVLNAKMRRTGICGATETLLIDKTILSTHLPPIVNALIDANCEIRGDEAVSKLDKRIKKANDDEWKTEYLDAIISIRAVNDLKEAIEHINTYGTQHTDAIITNNNEAAQQFLNEVDSAIVMHNTSTQFADGAEFGMGAEIGISTGKLHARGPVGVEQLTTFKYQVKGSGQIRS